MSSLATHLRSLIQDSDDASASDHFRKDVEQWMQLSKHISNRAAHDDLPPDESSDLSDFSVLKLYTSREGSSLNEPDAYTSKLLRLPDHESLMPAVHALLSSHDANDTISEQLLDLVGFEHIEIVMELLENRDEAQQSISSFLSSHNRDQPQSTSQLTFIDPTDLSSDAARQRMEQAFQENASKPLFSGVAHQAPEVLPHVYSSSNVTNNTILSSTGQKYLLPLGTTRHYYEEYEEVILPPARHVPPKVGERLIPIHELDDLAKGCFPGYTSLNRIQSIVYPTAYGTNENMLICAPTGAGKTDVAMLSILRVIDQHRSHKPGTELKNTIDRDAFKIIYVAPMKALAAEIVRKLAKRLRWLAIEVRELTGDMQMTKAEIAATQIIVTTPEKWDVVTRKPTGEGEIASSLKLLIIDEVHLLNDERGAVIETIVARTLRQVESSQSVIRVVGLSATLPNFVDVAEFLSVSKYKGLFYFDSSFRPIPLEQHFLGIRGKAGSIRSRKNLDYVTYQKVSELVAEGHQVMVFVHARKETVKSAMELKETATVKGNIDDFSCQDHPQWDLFRREIGQSRNKEMRELFDNGFGIHHAGMLRSDRNLMERLFEARAIKVLCCTATLAWGVNLPAHAVIIKGTQVYDSSKGSFVDLSVLDVLQIFGRAGRPGLETSGEGFICTTEDKLTHYLEAVTSQNPIESQFSKGLIDSLNAEISLGTVTNSHDAVQWLGYTYLFVRMRKNPHIYGIPRDILMDDPQLGGRRRELIQGAINKLVETNMVVHNTKIDRYSITDLGRIAAKYYLRYTSVEIFNNEFRPKMSEADTLAMLSKSTEFNQIQLRESEMKELEDLMARAPCDVKGVDTSQGKVNILLQAYISREMVEDFALVSDMAYVAQNAGRIIRALLEIALSRKWANVSTVLMGMSKAVEKRLWPYEHPLRQFDLKAETLYKIQEWADEWAIQDLIMLDSTALGELIHANAHQGQAVLKTAKQLPAFKVDYNLRPLGPDVLSISIQLNRDFTWNTKTHGNAEAFWVWVEDNEGVTILQLAHLIVRPTTESTKCEFVINIPDGSGPPFLTIRVISDRWLGAEEEIPVPLEFLIMPVSSQSHTALLPLPLLSTSVIEDPVIKAAISQEFLTFDAIQTQAYWTLMRTEYHSLLCAPNGNGKTTMARFLALVATKRKPDFWTLIVTSNKSNAFELYAELQPLCSFAAIPLELALLPGKILSRPKGKLIRVVTAEKILEALWNRDPLKNIPGLNLVVCDGLDQLSSSYEWAISLLRHATQSQATRYVGLSNSLSDPADLADWLNVHPTALLGFRPRNRDQELNFSIRTFTMPHSATLLKAMAKPTHSAIQSTPPGEAAIVFVPSKGQCRSIALNLLTQCMLETESTRGYLPERISNEYIEDMCVRLQDSNMADFISKGIGFFHHGIKKQDRLLMLGLFAEGIIRVLLVPRDSVFSLPVRAAVVVVMGTQYVDLTPDSTSQDRQVKEYSLVEIVQMQSRAVRHTGAGHFYLFCQAEVKDTLTRFLNDGLPLESSLLSQEQTQTQMQANGNMNVLMEWMKAQKVDWKTRKQDLLDVLSFSFLYRRVATNPSYYGCSSRSKDFNMSRIVDRLVKDVAESTSITTGGDASGTS